MNTYCQLETINKQNTALYIYAKHVIHIRVVLNTPHIAFYEVLGLSITLLKVNTAEYSNIWWVSYVSTKYCSFENCILRRGLDGNVDIHDDYFETYIPL